MNTVSGSRRSDPPRTPAAGGAAPGEGISGAWSDMDARLAPRREVGSRKPRATPRSLA
ncbi:hypothetical protein NUM3379_40250 [Kineococcus sp. NUM-3379]